MCWSGWGESGQVPAVSTQTHRWEGWKLDRDIYNHSSGPFISVVRDLFWVQVYFKMHFMWIRVEMSDVSTAILHVSCRFHHLKSYSLSPPHLPGVIYDIMSGHLQDNGNELLTVAQVPHLPLNLTHGLSHDCFTSKIRMPTKGPTRFIWPFSHHKQLLNLCEHLLLLLWLELISSVCILKVSLLMIF